MLGPQRLQMVVALLAAIALGAPTHDDATAAAQQLQPGIDTATNVWAARLVDRLNEQFLNGKPADSFAEAGVVVHQFDDAGFDTGSRRLREGGVSGWAPWTPCPEGHWCSKFGDRFSVSIINARAPFIFNLYNGGLIIDPSVSQKAELCSWATDARSFRAARTCLAEGVRFRWGDRNQTFARREGCIPGCVSNTGTAREDWDTVLAGQLSPTWCDPAATSDSWCPWRVGQLKRMMQQQERGFRNNDCAQNNGCRYNEVRAVPLYRCARSWSPSFPPLPA